MRFLSPTRAVAAVALLTPSFFPTPATAIDLDATQPDQVRSAAKDVAGVLWSMYASSDNKVLSGIPGLLTYPPYYWWQAGAMFGQLIDYWYYTNDSTYNDMIRDGMIHQMGDQKNYMPANQSKDEGNDDQLFWAFTLMSAAENNFPNPPSDQPGWLALAQSIFNQLASRWDPQVCGGGVRWQIYQWLPGWNYKNLASNGGYFQLGARLALYTGNDSYAQKASEIFDWLEHTSPLVTNDYQVYDGSDTTINCTKSDQTQWTYNYGIMIGGSAYMYNYTNGSQIWRDRLQGFINHTAQFFPDQYEDVLMDFCEINQKCDGDMVSFKGYLARWYAVTIQLAPWTAPQLLPRLQKSGKAAAQACVGTSSTGGGSYACGNRWYWQGFDGNGGVGQQLAALAVISSNLVTDVPAPFTSRTGGTSQGNPGLGTGGNSELPIYDHYKVTTGDKAGSAILTILALVTSIGGAWWLIA